MALRQDALIRSEEYWPQRHIRTFAGRRAATHTGLRQKLKRPSTAAAAVHRWSSRFNMEWHAEGGVATGGQYKYLSIRACRLRGTQ